MSRSGTDDEGGSDPGTGAGVMKRWSWKANDAYFVNILIRSCIEIVESGEIMSLPKIEANLMDVWHRRLECLRFRARLFFFYMI